jgi:large subunit ribosomal protein L22
MQVRAKLKNLRVSPKKVRLVVDLVRGADAADAQNQLSFLNKGSAKDILKLLNSAIANGENNYGLKKNNLFVKEIRVDEGTTIKRWRPRAFGRAGMIRKKMSHVSLVLDEKVPTPLEKIKKAKVAAPKVVKASEAAKSVTDTETPSKETKTSMIKDSVSQGGSSGKGFAKKIFQRKAT